MSEILFGTLHPDGTMTDERRIRRSDIAACEHFILAPEHYRPDGSCRCDDRDHKIMAEWGYRWDGERWR